MVIMLCKRDVAGVQPLCHLSAVHLSQTHLPGVLMTLLCGACRRYSYSAVALNYLTSAVVMLEGIFFIGLVQQMVFGPKRCDTQLCKAMASTGFTWRQARAMPYIGLAQQCHAVTPCMRCSINMTCTVPGICMVTIMKRGALVESAGSLAGCTVRMQRRRLLV